MTEPATFKRFCQRCRVFRQVTWGAAGTPRYCAPCLAEMAAGQETPAQVDAKIRRREKRRLRAVEIKAWLRRYKAHLGCWYCPENDPACLDLHHVDPGLKKFNISLACRTANTLDALKQEIDKCRVVCSNCHRKLHYRERNKELEEEDYPDLGEIPSSSEAETTFGDFVRTVKIATPVQLPPLSDEVAAARSAPGFSEVMAELRRKCFPGQED
jgi:hypothetical protein